MLESIIARENNHKANLSGKIATWLIYVLFVIGIIQSIIAGAIRFFLSTELSATFAMYGSDALFIAFIIYFIRPIL
jgi:hypothetical protein